MINSFEKKKKTPTLIKLSKFINEGLPKRESEKVFTFCNKSAKWH